MFVLVVGGGKVGYYLAKELIESGHELVLMEKDPGRAGQIADDLGSIVIARDGCEGNHRPRPAASVRTSAAVTGDDEDNLVICQMAKHHFDVRGRRPGQPEERGAVPAPRCRRADQPDRMVLGRSSRTSVHELLHLAALGGGELEIIEAQLRGARLRSAGRP
jgi:trk system potassium uptake protein TrkA